MCSSGGHLATAIAAGSTQDARRVHGDRPRRPQILWQRHQTQIDAALGASDAELVEQAMSVWQRDVSTALQNAAVVPAAAKAVGGAGAAAGPPAASPATAASSA